MYQLEVFGLLRKHITLNLKNQQKLGNESGRCYKKKCFQLNIYFIYVQYKKKNELIGLIREYFDKIKFN